MRKLNYLILSLIMFFGIFLGGSASASPVYVAPWIGAVAANWNTANSQIGPLHTKRVYFTTLPPTWQDSSNWCNLSPPGVLCVISYRTPDTNVTSFIQSIPSNQPVAITYYHEPEDSFPGTGTQYVAAFEAQSTLMRAAINGRSNIRIVLISASSKYGSSKLTGYDCSWIPPGTYVDKYLTDIYQPDGTPLQTSAQFQRWLQCSNQGKERGIAEIGFPPDSCIASGMTRSQLMLADASYIHQNYPAFWLFEVWWQDLGDIGPSYCQDHWQFTDQPSVSTWQSIENGTAQI